MRTAISASTLCVLGASLIAIALPNLAAAATSEINTNAVSDGLVNGISGGSTQGISGGSTLGISGGSTQGISGGSTQGISGGSTLGISGGSTLGISAGSVHLLVLAGPVDSVNVSEGIFMSLGQRVSAPGVTLAGLRLGDYVIVGGKISGAGTIQAHAVSRTGLQYTPGSSEVYVTGIPSSVDTRTGTAMIGELKVDYTPSLGGLGFEGIGAAITFIGTQPALGGIMISDRVLDKTELFLGR